MSGRRFDTKTTTFSTDGRLYQVEYAVAAIGNAPLTLGMLTNEGVLLVAERPQHSELLDTTKSEEKDISGDKMYLIDEHLAVSAAGLTADANTLINHARLTAQRHTYSYHEPMHVEKLVHQICDIKQGYTHMGGLRPFGVAFLYAGWDDAFGFQLYHSDPSGNYSAWKANAIGQGTDTAQGVLKSDWKDGMTMKEAMLLGCKILSRTKDGQLSEDKIEFGKLTKAAGKSPKFHICTAEETKEVVEESKRIQEEEERQKEKERKEKGTK
eukprot:TRINITY_DN43150_c0_g1_i1.p1 TRINITY_DN43150_c0_g1~~TRINITY_DN43150_c0_g1_i1.p1  ORF type:complete len:268 (+),score=115.24 TRINITY_DN43150_c0_g1_i1:202-1005(+)